MDCPPRIQIPETPPSEPDAFYGWGQLAIDFANAYVNPPGQQEYDWQEDVIYAWFATDPIDHRNLYSSCGLIVPRQNGKTKRVAVVRMLVGAIFKGEKIRYSAQRASTMEEIFRLCCDIVGNPDDPKHTSGKQEKLYRDYPEFYKAHKALYERIGSKPSFVNGHYKITFNTGGVIYFGCRTKDAARGETTDINILDEAQTLTESMLDDLLPGQAAAEGRNPQTIYIGTPPQLDRETGEAFYKQREAATGGAPRWCWHEWSVAEVGDVSDRRRWYETNPSLGKALMIDELEKDFYSMSPVNFAIEHLCYWPQTATPYVLDADIWDAAAIEPDEVTKRIPPDKVIKRCYGIKFAPDGLRVCVSRAFMTDDGNTHGELKIDGDTIDGIKQIEDLIFNDRERTALVAIDGKTGAGELYERLRKRKDAKGKVAFPQAQLHLMRTTEVPTATTMVANGIAEKTLTHTKNEALDASAKGSERRKIGNDGFGFGGDNCCAIESFAAANWAVKTTTRTTEKRKWKR